MMQLILRHIPPKHLLDPIWIAGDHVGPSYIQASMSSRENFRVVLKRSSSRELTKIVSHLSDTDLFELAKSISPDIATDLLRRGISIDRVAGPDGQSIWHTVVQYHEQPQEMLQWLLHHCSHSINKRAPDGSTPLMLAIGLGKLDAATWLSERCDLGMVNSSTGLTAPELAAKKSQTNEEISIFRVIVENIALDHQSGRDLMRRTINAVYISRRDYTRRLKIRNQRQRYVKGIQSLGKQLEISDKATFLKMQIICCATGFGTE
jgi:hypothetical protein